MESDSRGGKRRRKTRLIVIGCCALAVLVVVVVVTVVVLSNRTSKTTDAFRATFIGKCEKWTAGNKSTDCVKIWSAFTQAYVGRDPCRVPMEAYDHLISAAPLQPMCNKVMFWSGTKEVAHKVSKGCYQTAEDTLLGSVLDGLTWCGKEGSNDTYTSGCPAWNSCENQTMKSFWSRASAEFAVTACGDTIVMLNGSRVAPFNPDSVFGRIEIKKFTSPRITSLTVVLVTNNNNVVANCADQSLKNLRKELKPGIQYFCKEVTESKLLSCKETDRTCKVCW